MSLEEYFCEGPKIRVPPCSLPPLAGAHVGRAAVVIGLHRFRSRLFPFLLSPTSFAGNTGGRVFFFPSSRRQEKGQRKEEEEKRRLKCDRLQLNER